MLLALLLVGADPAPAPAANVVLITLDGFRWQELFGGLQEALANRADGGVRDVPGLKKRFDGATPEERRRKLLPFFWELVAAQGQVIGAPEADSKMTVTNGHNFSYPGYNELLCGFPDARIDSNAKTPNPNVTVLEWLHRRPGFEGKVAAFGSWDVFPAIVNERRSGVPVNAGWQPFEAASHPERLAALNQLGRDLVRHAADERVDALTFRGCHEYLLAKRPRVLYLAFGETDHWGHDRRYDLYLHAAHRADAQLRELWETLQKLPSHAGRTALVLCTDHGRGPTRDWTDHGKKVPGCDRIWFAALGAGVAPGGLRRGLTATQGQTAATVAALLGADYATAQPRAAKPIPGVAGPTSPARPTSPRP